MDLVNVFPLLDVPVSAFFRTLDNNHAVLYDLRVSSARGEGFFLVKDFSGEFDSFTLSGDKFQGKWKLGRIRLIEGMSYPYAVELYRRRRNKDTTRNGCVYHRGCVDDRQVAETIATLNGGFFSMTTGSFWDIQFDNLFADMGFDVY